jgi:hypothetical protein
METAEAAVAEASDMGDTHAVRETRAPVIGGTKAAIHTNGATHPTHAMARAVVEAVADFANPTPGGIGAMIEAAVVGLAAIKDGGVAVIIPAQCAAITRIVRQPARTGVGLGGGRL